MRKGKETKKNQTDKKLLALLQRKRKKNGKKKVGCGGGWGEKSDQKQKTRKGNKQTNEQKTVSLFPKRKEISEN